VWSEDTECYVRSVIFVDPFLEHNRDRTGRRRQLRCAADRPGLRLPEPADYASVTRLSLHLSVTLFTMSSRPYVQPGEPLNEFLRSFWQRQVDAAEQETPDYRHPALPLARIKKVMKNDPEVKVSQLSRFDPKRVDSSRRYKDDSSRWCGIKVFLRVIRHPDDPHGTWTAPILFCKACESTWVGVFA
jgi:hypothetical protein